MGGLAFLVLIGGALAADSETGFIGGMDPKQMAHSDPTVETTDWTGVRVELARRGLLGRPNTFIAAPKWSQAGKLDMALGDVMPVVVLSHDPRQYGYRYDPKALVGKDALIIGRTDLDAGAHSRVRRAISARSRCWRPSRSAVWGVTRSISKSSRRPR